MKTVMRISSALLVFVGLFTMLLMANDTAMGQDSVRTIHVFVALCDNENQGIVPVPPQLGNGEDPRNNLYWGALYGVKTFFKKSEDWDLMSTMEKPKAAILERCVFKHNSSDTYLVADAYQGIEIKRTVIDFLESAAGQNRETVAVENGSEGIILNVGGNANLVAYVGHDGLMDFQLESYPEGSADTVRDAIILACVSRSFFAEPLHRAGANPLLWTTGLMAPEAYTLKSAIDGWILNESPEKIRERAAKAYHQHQKCGLRAATNLLVTGW